MAKEQMESRLIAAAREVRERAYAPFSNFRVGAAVETADGEIYTGCNIESASYGLTVCAERVAIWKALSECERDFTDLVIVVDTEQLTPPCGTCRQIIWEYTKDAKITLANLKGQSEVVDIRELLPKAFDARFLQGGAQ